jgi:hypothetical protein
LTHQAFVQGISIALSFVLLNINVAVSVGGLVSGLLDFIFASIDLFNNARWQNEINRRGRLNRFTAKAGQNKMEDKTQSQIRNLINAADEGDAAVAQADLKRMNKLKEQLAKLKQAGASANVRGSLGKAPLLDHLARVVCTYLSPERSSFLIIHNTGRFSRTT